VVADRGSQHALGQIGAGSQGRCADPALDLAQPRERRARLVELAPRDPRPDQELERRRAVERPSLRHLAQDSLD